MNRNLRIRILNKIAQTEPAAKPVPPAPSITASQAYPSIRSGFDAAKVAIIDSLVGKLNVAIHTVTGGTYNLQILKNKNFIFDPSSFQSPDQKNLANFFVKVYQKLLNSGNAFAHPLTDQELAPIIDSLLQAPELKNLSQVNPTGQVAQKVSSNIQQDIKSDLTRLLPNIAVRSV